MGCQSISTELTEMWCFGVYTVTISVVSVDILGISTETTGRGIHEATFSVVSVAISPNVYRN